MTTSAVRAGSAFVEVGLRSKVQEGARRIQAQLTGVASTFKTFGTGIAAAGATATAAFGGILAALSWPTKLAADMEVTRAGFLAMLGDGEKVTKLMGDLQKFAAQTPFEFPELAESARMLMAFGVPLEDIIGTLRKVGDVSSGINAPMGEIAEIFGKARVQGRLFMEDINQLTGRGIPVIQELAKQFGVTESEVRKLVENGKVNFSNLERAFSDLTSAGGIFADQMAVKSKTLIGLFSSFKDNIGQALAPVGQSLVDALKPVLEFAGAMLRPIGEFIAANARLVTVIAGISVAGAGLGVAALTIGGALIGVGSAIGGIIAAAPFLAGLWATVTAAIAPAVPVIAAVSAGLLAAGAAWGSILYIANQAGILKTVFEGIRGAVNELGKTVSATFGGITRALSAGEYSKAAAILWAGVKLAFFQGAKAAYDAFTWLFNNGLTLATDFAKALGQTLWNVFKSIPQLLSSALMGGASLAEILAKALSGGLENSLNESIASAQTDLAKLTADPKSKSSSVQPGKGNQAAAMATAELTDNEKAIQSRIDALRDETTEMKLGADAFDLLKLKQQGATDEQLRQVKQLQAYRDQMKAKTKADEDAKARTDDLIQRGKQLTEEVRNPLQVFGDKMREIDTLLAAGAITRGTALLQKDKAREELNAPMRDAIRSGRNTIADINTQGALDVVLRTRKSFEGQGSGKDKAEDLAAKQLEQLTKIANSAERGNTTTIKIQTRRL